MCTLLLLATSLLGGTLVQDDTPPGGWPWGPRRAWEIASPADGTVFTGHVVAINICVIKPLRETGHVRVTRRNGSANEVSSHQLGEPRSITISIDNGGSAMPDGEYVIDLFAHSQPGRIMESVVVTIVDGEIDEALPTIDSPPNGSLIVTYDGIVTFSGKTASKVWVALYRNGEYLSTFMAESDPARGLLWRTEKGLPVETAGYVAYAFPADPAGKAIPPTDWTDFQLLVPIDADPAPRPPLVPGLAPDWKTIGQ